MKTFNLQLLAEILGVHSVSHATLNAKKTEFKITYRETLESSSSWFEISVNSLIPRMKAYIKKTGNTVHIGEYKYGYSAFLNIELLPTEAIKYKTMVTSKSEASALYLVCNYIYNEFKDA